MTLDELLQRYSAFVKTPEYLEGLFVEVSGMAIDILLLTILVPTIFWIVQLRNKIQAQRTASFLCLQFLRDCTTLLLRAGGIQNLNEALHYELKNDRLSELFSHSIYGNSENLLEMLRFRMARGSHILGHRSLEMADIRELREEAEGLVRQCEQYVVLFSSLRLHTYSERCFRIGVILFALRDYMKQMEPLAGSTRPTDGFRTLSTDLATAIDEWFSRERKIPDKALHRSAQITMVKLILQMPYTLVQRYVIGPIMTRIGIEYRDPWKLDIVRVLLEKAYKSAGSAEVFKTLNLSGKQVRKILSLPSASNEAITFLLALRALFPADRWDAVLVSTIFQELTRVKPDVVTSSHYIADASAIYVRASFKQDAEVLIRIMSWASSYEGIHSVA